MYKVKDLRSESDEELNAKLQKLYQELFDFRGETSDSKVKKTHVISQKRKEVARILTLKRERELRENSR